MTKSCLGPLGYLFMALPTHHYHRYTTLPLNLPGPTPNLPNFVAGAGVGRHKTTRINWNAHKSENSNISNMNEALTALFLAAITTPYKKHPENYLVGRTESNFWSIFSSFLIKYGKIKPMDLENNLQCMKNAWDPTSTIEDLFAQINDVNEYSIFARSPYINQALVNAGKIIILQTNTSPQEYKDWISVDPADCT